jgi:hypothetical protein
MNESFKQAVSDKLIKWGMSIASLLIAIEIFSSLFFYFSLPPFIPIYNQMPWGDDRLGTKLELLLPSGITLLFLLLNFFLLSYLYKKIPLISRIISVTTLLIAILSLIFTIRTLHLIL